MASKKRASKRGQKDKVQRSRVRFRDPSSQSSKKGPPKHRSGAVRKSVARPRRSSTSGPRRKPLERNEYAAVKQAIGLIRKHVNGYEASDGYGFRDIASFSAQKRKRLKAKAGSLKQILSTPHDIIVPRTKKDRRGLVQFTRQRLRRAKHFIVHKPGDNFRTRVRKGRVSVVGAFPGRVQSESRYFLFDRRPRHPDDVERMLKKMLREMPRGFYVMLTGAIGDTGEPMERDALVAGVQAWMNAYGTKATGESSGAMESIIGFRFMSSKLEGMEVQMKVIDRRRQSRREFNAAMDKYYKAKARGENPPLPKWTPTFRRTMRAEHKRLEAQRAKRKVRSKK